VEKDSGINGEHEKLEKGSTSEAVWVRNKMVMGSDHRGEEGP